MAVKFGPMKVGELLMVWMWRSKVLCPEIMPAMCPISCRMVVRRSYFPAALEVVVARKAVSVRGWVNSLWSKGVGSMYHPMPLASVSISMVPPVGRPLESNLVTTASASCPVGRSFIWRLMFKGLVGLRREVQRVWALLLMV